MIISFVLHFKGVAEAVIWKFPTAPEKLELVAGRAFTLTDILFDL